jgi:RNA polymerase sigma-70 factor (ECF subfamily)
VNVHDVSTSVERALEPLEARLPAQIPPLRPFLARLTGGAGADAEDLLQEVMARALRYRDSFDPRRPLGPWLRTTALRAWFDLRERRRREPIALGEDERELAAPPAPEVGAGEGLEALLKPLSAVEREVLLRFHRDGASVREVAAALGMPEGTVKSHLHRARRRLADLARSTEEREDTA